MTLQEIKRISIQGYLEQKDLNPVRLNEKRGMYLSPLRKEDDASFSVDYVRNVWFDHGLGEGGSIIDLVSRMENCSIGEAIKRLEDDYFSFRRNENFVSNNSTVSESAIKILNVIPVENHALLSYLAERRINIDVAEQYCKEIHYSMNDKPYFALGFRNDAGGYELRNKYFKGCTSKDITRFKAGQNSCQLFEGFMDYLSFLTLKNWQQSPVDVIVLNSLSNLPKIKVELIGYKNVAAFLDNDEAGKKATEELRKFCKNINDQSDFYRGYKDLNDYLCGKQIQQKRDLKL